MKIATITEAKNGLSALIDLVRAGGSVLIVDRGRPVARLEPAISPAEQPEGRLARLQRAGVVRVGGGPAPVQLVMKKPPRARGTASVVEALLEERRESR